MNENWLRKRSLFTAPAKKVVLPKQRTSLLGVLGRALKRSCIMIGALVLFSVFLGMFSAAMIGTPRLPEKFVLHFPIDSELIEHGNQTGYGFGPRPMTIRQVAGAIDRAAEDRRVTGIVAELRGGGYNLAHIDELRRAIANFRAAGKYAHIYATSYGDTGGGIGTYYLAAAFSDIWLQPMGLVSIPGLRAEIPFLRGTLDKIGVTPQFFARKEYKSVFESLMAQEMSDETREMTTALVEDIAQTLSTGISADRGMTPQALRAAVDRALLLDHEAQAAGLVDHVEFFDVLEQQLGVAINGAAQGEQIEAVKMARYVRATQRRGEQPRPPGKAAPKVALVYVVGTIMSGSGDSGSLSDAESISANILEAADDEDVKAIVVRIESPGGSPTASETIRRALVRAQERGKIVVVSMAATTASGGYWVAAPADYIFAAPATVTGSIGVAGGKFVLDDIWDKIGVNWETVDWGANSSFWSLNTLYTAPQRERMNALLDYIYDGFVARVAEGRGMSIEAVDQIARGRVWTGRQAQQFGLVDELGGLDSALDYTAILLGATDRQALNIMQMPEPKTPLELLVDLMEMQVAIGRFADLQMRMLESFAPLLSRFENAHNAAALGTYEPLSVRPQ